MYTTRRISIGVHLLCRISQPQFVVPTGYLRPLLAVSWSWPQLSLWLQRITMENMWIIGFNPYLWFIDVSSKYLRKIYVIEWRNISPNMGMSAVKLEIWKTTLDAQECVAKTNRDLIYPLVNIQKTMENHHFLKMGGKSTISMCHVLCRYVGLPEGSCAGNYPLVN
jgi:hypothetical protein